MVDVNNSLWLQKNVTSISMSPGFNHQLSSVTSMALMKATMWMRYAIGSFSFNISVSLDVRWRIYTIICLKSVVVRKLQVAILARSPREMSQTDRII